MLRKQKTEKKYADFIKDCYKEKTFSQSAMLTKHRVDASLFQTMRKDQFIVSVSADVCNWIEGKPNEVSIKRLIDSHRERVKVYVKRRAEKCRKERAIEEFANHPAPESKPSPMFEYYVPTPEAMTEESAVAFLKSIGGYEIFKVERKQL
jgi:hypothetical protein